MKKSLLVLIGFFVAVNLNAQSWNELGTGSNALNANNAINTIVADGSGNVYVTGEFTDSNGKYYVAKWNGTTWTELGSGTNALSANNIIYTIAIDGSGNVYAAGDFTNSNGNRYVAKWDGTVWSEVGAGSNALNANNTIKTIAIDGSGNIYAAGSFTDGAAFNMGFIYVSKWNGTSWSEITINGFNGGQSISSLISDKLGNIYATGLNYVYEWNGTTWSQVGTTLIDEADTELVIDGLGNIYERGNYTNDIIKWDGTTWAEMGTGSNALNANNLINAIAVSGSGILYAGGDFTDSNGKPYIAKWDGTTWSELGIGNNALNPNNVINVIAVDGSDNVYAAGHFTDSNGKFYVAKYTNIVTAVENPYSINDFSIYPNPSKGQFNITLPEDGQLSVYNFSGALISTQKLSAGSSSINLGNALSGVYTLVFNGQNNSYAPVKLVKE